MERTSIKGPAIVLSNHTSFYDFIYTTAALYPRRVTYLAASKMFYEKRTRGFLKMARAIPKSLMQADPVATLKAFRILKKNGIVSVFPEGQISPSGRTLKPSFSIAKFVKKADVDVYIVKHHGAGLVNPPWSKKTFSGVVETHMFRMLKKEEIRTKSLDEIYQCVCKSLDFSPSQYVRNTQATFKTNDISNLENVIYQCPKCLNEGLTSKKTYLFCETCGEKLFYDQYGMLNHQGLDERFLEQSQHLNDQIKDDPSYELCGKTKLMSFRNNQLVYVGEGILCVKRFIYTYEGTIDQMHQKLTFKVENTPSLPSDIGRNVQIYEGDQIYQFELEIPYLPTKFVHASEYLYEIHTQK